MFIELLFYAQALRILGRKIRPLISWLLRSSDNNQISRNTISASDSRIILINTDTSPFQLHPSGQTLSLRSCWGRCILILMHWSPPLGSQSACW